MHQMLRTSSLSFLLVSKKLLPLKYFKTHVFVVLRLIHLTPKSFDIAFLHTVIYELFIFSVCFHRSVYG